MRKTCNHCKKELNLSKFYSNPTSKDGFFYTCKQCINIKRRKKPIIKHKKGLKQCCTCKQHKEYKQFNIDKAKKDGYNLNCKDCVAIYRRNYKKVKEIDYSKFYLPVNLD